MNSEMISFILRQLLNSTAVIGPILILVSLCFYFFRMVRRQIFIYLSIGVIFSTLGIYSLTHADQTSAEISSTQARQK